jgi:hypothetical protein
MLFQSKIEDERTGAAAHTPAVIDIVVPAASDAISNSRLVTMLGSFHCGGGRGDLSGLSLRPRRER